jgi:pilus assembly protein CpaE
MPEKILVVDDELDTLKLVGMMLESKGYEIIAASNGRKP